MRTLIYWLPAIACVVMMLVMCGPMLFRRNKNQVGRTEDDARSATGSKDAEASEQIAELHDEVAALKAKLAFQEQERAERPR